MTSPSALVPDFAICFTVPCRYKNSINHKPKYLYSLVTSKPISPHLKFDIDCFVLLHLKWITLLLVWLIRHLWHHWFKTFSCNWRSPAVPASKTMSSAYRNKDKLRFPAVIPTFKFFMSKARSFIHCRLP